MKFLLANKLAPDGTPRSAASHLGLCSLPMSHKRDARLKWHQYKKNIKKFPMKFSFFFTPEKIKISLYITTLYTVDATEYVTAQIDATFHEVSEECKTVS